MKIDEWVVREVIDTLHPLGYWVRFYTRVWEEMGGE